MKLNDLLNNIPIQAASCDLTAEVAGITLDSRRCKPGYVFCAVVGAESGVPGIRYAQKAVENGAVCVLCDTDCPADLPFVRVADAELALAEVSANFYGHPAEKLRLIGVTGTNGKTTTTHLVRDILTHAGKKCGLIGTNELMIGDQVITSHPVFSTTPEPPELHALFAQMVEAGCEFAVMEVSSHALALNRVYGLRFEVAAFTNLSQDHLNYHGTMEAYAAAKAKLFRQADCSVINLDDAYAQQMIDAAAGKTVTFSLRNNKADLIAKSIRFLPHAAEFEALTLDSIQRMRINIPGAFSVENALTAVGICNAVGVSLPNIAEGLAGASGVCGRAEIVPVGQPYTVMIDYAHSPDSLSNILKTVRPVTEGQLIVVFGCGGDRDRTKRPIMGRIAECMADFCIVTSDNPRTEEPEAIIDEIVGGMKKTNHIRIENRRKAIGHALDMAKPGDFVLIAGKGHEMYQEIQGVRHPFDEREVVRTHLQGKGLLS